MEYFLEEQAQNFANKFPSESYESPQATSSPHKFSVIDKLMQKKLSPSMGGPYVQVNPTVDDLSLHAHKKDNEYLSTPEKKLKYKVLSKNMATKLAFKNLKATLFKNHSH